MQASKHPAHEVGGYLAGIIAGCLMELRVVVLRGSYCSGMLSGSLCRGAMGFIGDQGMTGLDPTAGSNEYSARDVAYES